MLTRCTGSLPAIFGLHIVTYILCELAEKPISNPLPIKNRRKLYERMLRDLLIREQKLKGETIKYAPCFFSLSFDVHTTNHSQQ